MQAHQGWPSLLGGRRVGCWGMPRETFSHGPEIGFADLRQEGRAHISLQTPLGISRSNSWSDSEELTIPKVKHCSAVGRHQISKQRAITAAQLQCVSQCSHKRAGCRDQEMLHKTAIYPVEADTLPCYAGGRHRVLSRRRAQLLSCRACPSELCSAILWLPKVLS